MRKFNSLADRGEDILLEKISPLNFNKEAEIRERILLGWQDFDRLSSIFKSKITLPSMHSTHHYLQNRSLEPHQRSLLLNCKKHNKRAMLEIIS